MRDASVTLQDGRSLAYTDLGLPDSPVVMYCHGAPSTRLELAMFEDALAAIDVRVISADRPGYGRSSPLPGRRREDWPADDAVLADHLGVERFAVLGLSSGGPYAVACAALLAEQVTAAGVVGGETDFGWSGAWDGYPENEGTLMRIDDEAQGAAWCEARYGRDGSRFLEEGIGELAPSDEAALEDEAFATALMTTVSEAFRQGVDGFAQDVVIQGRPWSFDPGAIAAPVWIHHGELDTLTPVAHGRHTADLIPNAKLVIWPDQGHLSLIMKMPEIAAGVADSLR
jgi:pimeloyl-ACP methyl ester carboxylesterase